MKAYRFGSDLDFVCKQVEDMRVGDLKLVTDADMDFHTMRMALCKIARDSGVKYKTRRISSSEMRIERIA